MSAETLTESTDTSSTDNAPDPFAMDPSYIEDGKILGEFSSTREVLEALAAARGTQTPEVAPVAPVVPTVPPIEPAATLDSLQITEPAVAPAAGTMAPEALARYNAEVAKDGKLSDASLTELTALGYAPEVAQGYAQGLVAQRKLAAQEVASSVGGMSVVTAALGWAKANKTPAEIASLNGVLTNSDVAAQSMVIRGLVAESGALNPAISGITTPIADAQVYQSEAQWMSDLGKPEYKKDPAFRKKVMERMKATDETGGFTVKS